MEETYKQLERATTVAEFNRIRSLISQEAIKEQQRQESKARLSGKYEKAVVNSISIMR